jgi:hypothetical protein
LIGGGLAPAGTKPRAPPDERLNEIAAFRFGGILIAWIGTKSGLREVATEKTG